MCMRRTFVLALRERTASEPLALQSPNKKKIYSAFFRPDVALIFEGKIKTLKFLLLPV